ncbi:MAG: NAD(+)/NADH kinase [Lachnospiraceae bacterium]|nr:NAD(+)/NADH kinase [Lachnospiraceae bacterium]
MKRFYLVSNIYKDEGFRLRDQVAAYLTERGATCMIHEDGLKPDPETECVITLGGDGTLLRVVRRFADLSLSFIGINTGTVGYLTEGDRRMIPTVLDALLEDRFIREKRMMIFGRIYRNGRSAGRHRALNDVVVRSKNAMKIVNLRVYVNGQFLKDYRCDGLIASTPTGSTAYNFSAGGPIVEPTARLLVLTPVAAHSLNNRSIVFSPSDKISVEILPPSSGNETEEAFQVCFDGEKPETLDVGDSVEITQASTTIQFLKLSERSFIETMRIKLPD